MKKKVLTGLLVICIFAGCFVGCGSTQQVKEETATEEAAEKKPEKTPEAEKKVVEKEEQTEKANEETMLMIGNKDEGSYEVIITNNTGLDITGVYVKTADDEVYPANFLESDDAFKSDEKRVLYCAKSLNDGASYTMFIDFADGTKAELLVFPITDMKEAALKLDQGVAYIVYTTVSAPDSEVNTLDSEKATKAAYEAMAAAQTQTVTETQPDTSDYEVYEEPEYAEETPSNNSPSDETCIDDGLTY